MHKILFSLAVFMTTFTSVMAQEETSVLFIGNSFTFMNDMPFMFRDIAASEGQKVIVDTCVHGGKDFEYHAKNPHTYAKINSRKWDYIVIQGHSNEFAQPDSKIETNTIPYVRQIVDSIRKNSSCTQLVVYMTWAYKNGNSKWAPISSYDSMQLRIKQNYLKLADLFDARVSPVGEVWKTVRKNYSGLNLYFTDLQHPNLLGSYLSACTHFTTIFGMSPVHNKAEVAIDAATRQIIEMNAAQVVLNNLQEWRNVPRGPVLESGYDIILQNKTVQLHDNSKNAQWIEWEFGDGSVSVEKNPEHVYKSKGVYSIIQKISASCKKISLTRKIEIK